MFAGAMRHEFGTRGRGGHDAVNRVTFSEPCTFMAAYRTYLPTYSPTVGTTGYGACLFTLQAQPGGGKFARALLYYKGKVG